MVDQFVIQPPTNFRTWATFQSTTKNILDVTFFLSYYANDSCGKRKMFSL